MPVCRNSSHDLGPTGVTRGISVFFTGERVFVLFDGHIWAQGVQLACGR